MAKGRASLLLARVLFHRKSEVRSCESRGQRGGGDPDDYFRVIGIQTTFNQDNLGSNKMPLGRPLRPDDDSESCVKVGGAAHTRTSILRLLLHRSPGP